MEQSNKDEVVLLVEDDLWFSVVTNRIILEERIFKFMRVSDYDLKEIGDRPVIMLCWGEYKVRIYNELTSYGVLFKKFCLSATSFETVINWTKHLLEKQKKENEHTLSEKVQNALRDLHQVLTNQYGIPDIRYDVKCEEGGKRIVFEAFIPDEVKDEFVELTEKNVLSKEVKEHVPEFSYESDVNRMMILTNEREVTMSLIHEHGVASQLGIRILEKLDYSTELDKSKIYFVICRNVDRYRELTDYVTAMDVLYFPILVADAYPTEESPISISFNKTVREQLRKYIKGI